jgi:hypothetical protein
MKAPMTKEEFERLFDAKVGEPLSQSGFQRSGKSLYADANLASVSLIRLGGRMARSGAISHVVCCRMSFMRDRTERIPEGFVPDPFDYPFKFLPTKLSANLQYVPQNLRYDRELLEFQARRNALVQQDLEKLTSSIVERVQPWAASLAADAVKNELLTLGENAWCERMWIEDCENYLNR